MMEIPARRDCDGTCGKGRDVQYWACPFFSDDDGTESCAVFGVNMYGIKCPACLSAYPNGATVTITAKEKPCMI